jgi:hypothetical protein
MKKITLVIVLTINVFIFILLSNTYCQVPKGAITKKQNITHEYAPKGWESVINWFQAATISQNNEGEGKIVIDYIRVYEYNYVSKLSSVIFEENYDESFRTLSYDEGGLFKRNPKWYADDEHDEIFNSKISNGYLTIYVSETPCNIVHFWTDRFEINRDCKYYTEIKVKIIGKVGLQLGSDWWRTMNSSWSGLDVNNTEAWVSDWYGDTNGKFITIVAPK